MTTDHDPLVAAWFADSAHRFDEGDSFTNDVMRRARFAKHRRWLPFASASLVVVAAIWWFAIPVELARLVATLLTTTLVDLGEGWVAWLLAPINSIAALLALTVKLVRMCHGRIKAAGYAR